MRSETAGKTYWRKTIWIVVCGAAYVPTAFDQKSAAQNFADACEDYVSGPWEVVVETGYEHGPAPLPPASVLQNRQNWE